MAWCVHIRHVHLTTICCFAGTEDTKEQVNYSNKELEVNSYDRKLSRENYHEDFGAFKLAFGVDVFN
jgi:hypothetical protein